MTELLAVLTLVIGIPLNVYVLVKLRRLAGSNPVIHERSIVAAAVLLTVTVFGLIFINNDQALPPLDTYATKVITRLMVLILAIVPALYWLGLYRARAIT